MKLVGITGGVGMGKSTSAQFLRKRGIALVDTDNVARQVVEPGQPALAEVRAAFGPDVIGPDGGLRRDELARRVFSDESARKKLEEILHPRIQEIWSAQAAKWRSERVTVGVVVIPLLFETAAEGDFDQIICVACTAQSQRERLAARGWDETQIQQRITAQWPVVKKMELATHVVWTEAGLDVHAEQLNRIIPPA